MRSIFGNADRDKNRCTDETSSTESHTLQVIWFVRIPIDAQRNLSEAINCYLLTYFGGSESPMRVSQILNSIIPNRMEGNRAQQA
jgi:hypothetical protein